MELVHRLHNSGIQVDHSFDMRERIDFYESICKGYEKIFLRITIMCAAT